MREPTDLGDTSRVPAEKDSSSFSGAFGRTRDALAPARDHFTNSRASVIIPCFNSEHFVGEAIESAIEQTWPDVEVIVVDDGSTDGSRKAIKKFGDRIVPRWLNHGGASAARNAGLEVATGEFIQFLDADDLLLADAIERRVRRFEADVDAVFGDLEFFDHKTRNTVSSTSHAGWPAADPLASLIRHNIYTESPLHRRRLLYAIGGFDEGLPCSQELDLHIRLCLAGARFSYLPGRVSRARVHSSTNRIENDPWYLNDPDRHINIIEHHHRLISCRSTDLVTPAVRQAFAFKAWSRGMIAGRNGAFTVARRYFEHARRYWPTLKPEGSVLFRFSHALFGPNLAARALYQKRRLSDGLNIMGRKRD